MTDEEKIVQLEAEITELKSERDYLRSLVAAQQPIVINQTPYTPYVGPSTSRLGYRDVPV